MKAKPASKVSSKKLNALAKLFKEKRVEAGYDIQSLATHALVSSKVVTHLESEPQRVPLQDLYAVANVLNLDPGVVLELLHTATA